LSHVANYSLPVSYDFCRILRLPDGCILIRGTGQQAKREYQSNQTKAEQISIWLAHWALLPTSALGECRHRGFARCLAFFHSSAARRCASLASSHARAHQRLRIWVGANPSCAVNQTIAHAKPLHCVISGPSTTAMGQARHVGAL